MKIYLDNAATTKLEPAVFEAMLPFWSEQYGNPSAKHGFGRRARMAIEDSRAFIAEILHAHPEEIYFTSGGTEADNLAIHSAVVQAKIDHVITSPFEHHAVLQTLKSISNQQELKITFLRYDQKGNLDLDHLNELLKSKLRNFVSIMHANNEIGNLNDIEKISRRVQYSGSIFHTDTVQSMGHYRYDLSSIPVHYLAASGHKFHGPKGIGFLYCRKGTPISRLIHGGGQEKTIRAGTENVPAIIGLAKALEIAYQDLEKDHLCIQSLKDRMIYRLKEAIPDIRFNGNSKHSDKSLYTVLSVNLPETGIDLLQELDKQGIAASGGSACSGGSSSHVIEALGIDKTRTILRFSFSKFNKISDVDATVGALTFVLNALMA